MFPWSGRRDSNSRPSPWQGDALPTEPRPRGAVSSSSRRPTGRGHPTPAATVRAARQDAFGRRSIAQHQHAVLDRRHGVADDGEVLEVGLRLLDELLALLPRDRRQRAPLHRCGTVAEAGNISSTSNSAIDAIVPRGSRPPTPPGDQQPDRRRPSSSTRGRRAPLERRIALDGDEVGGRQSAASAAPRRRSRAHRVIGRTYGLGGTTSSAG